MVGIAVTVVLLAAVAFLASEAPRQSAVMWFVAVAVIPYWAYLPLGAGLGVPAVDVLAVIALGALALSRKRYDLPVPAPPMLVFCALAILGGYLGGMPNWYTRTILLSWAVPFYLGQALVVRFGKDWLVRVFRRLGLVLAVGALIEFATRWHPFVSLAPGSPVAFWADIQSRSGFDRSELAFGHSIALGGAIALMTPFVVGSASTRRRLPYTLLMVAAAATTLSRGTMIATGLALVLLVLFRFDTHRRRRVQLVALLLVAVIAVPALASVFSGAGLELQQSTAVRSSFFDDLTGTSRLVGSSAALEVNAQQQPVFGGYRSIDNAYLLLALQSGLLTLVAFLTLFHVPVRGLVSRNLALVDVAALAMIPLLATVAPLTQWQSLVFLVLGASYSWPRESRQLQAAQTRSMPEAPGRV